ncbi:PAS domain-containing protein [Sphingobium boeckii]|uniref:PAS domain-containing protein n=1 Tax=Sphingobium boeckii TaxID=1082345 RepID=A0A7W9AJZ0_9SPHN|nr:PAS domain-containing protein [Sphingobium boeckii]MBB5687030.1 PAS domain-containing protein [Sphingobium boeckii]
MPEKPVTTTAASLSRNFGLWQEKAMNQPVMVTHHGRPRAVLISVETYNSYKAGGGGDPAPDGDDSLVIDAVAQCFVALDRDFIVRRVNRAATVYFGRSAAALLGRPLTALYPAVQDMARARSFARVLRTRQSHSFDILSIVHPDQRIRVDAFPYGSGVGYLFQALPGDEAKQQAAEIEALKDLFGAHGSAAMIRLSLRGCMTRFDDTLMRMTGLAEERLISAPLADIVIAQDRTALSRAVEKVLEGKGATALAAALVRGSLVTIAIAETRSDYAIDGATVLVTPRAPDE